LRPITAYGGIAKAFSVTISALRKALVDAMHWLAKEEIPLTTLLIVPILITLAKTTLNSYHPQ
jgi:hypothetical protein